MSAKKHTIIVAGGKGERMGNDLPKQFLELNGLPLLMYSIKCFYEAIANMDIILVLPETQKEYWQMLCEKFNFKTPHRIINGGKERFYSVKNALKLVNQDSIVAIHDGVRPIISKGLIINTFRLAEEKGTAVPVIKIKESLRKIEGENSHPVTRDDFRIVQTPQCFHSSIILEAYKQEYKSEFTDDATVVESLGHKIFLIEGEAENIKITVPEDLRLAEFLMKE